MTRAFILALMAAAAAAPAAAETRLHILHINDFHSRIEPVNKYASTCTPEDDAAGDCFGGAARIAAKVAELRAAHPDEPLLLLDAGDQFQGSLMYTAYKGTAEADMMMAIGFDAMAVGNHEFDNGPEVLADFADRITFPLISGNLDFEGEPRLAARVQDHAVIETGGLKVGLVSAVTTETVDISSPGDGVLFEDEITALQADVDALEAEGVTHIVALTHVGLKRDVEIAGAVAGLDAVVGGHSHTLLSNTVAGAAGSYPLMIGDVPVVQAGSYGRYLGHLVLTFDDAGQVTAAEGDTIALDATVAPDPTIATRVAELAAPLAAIKAEVVGETASVIDASDCRAAECPMGNLVADAMLAATRTQGVMIAIQNGGGLRASIDAGPVTMGEVLAVLPFQNTLATFEATGGMITEALENGLSQVEDGAGRFPQVAGMRFVWDPSAGPNEGRVVSVDIRTGDDWVPLDPEATYLAVTNNYMRTGGDGYRMFLDATEAYDFGPGLEEVVARHLTDMRTAYTPYTDGRIRRR